MAKRKRSSQQRSFAEWQRRMPHLIRMADHGKPLLLDAEQFDIQGRDRSWNLSAQNFLSANPNRSKTKDALSEALLIKSGTGSTLPCQKLGSSIPGITAG